MHFHRNYSIPSGAVFKLCLSERGIAIIPGNAAAVSALKNDNQGMLRTLERSLFASATPEKFPQLPPTQPAPDLAGLDLPALSHYIGQQAAIAGLSAAEAVQITKTLLDAFEVSPQAMQQLLDDLLKQPPKPKVDQMLDDATTLLDDLDHSVLQRNSAEGQAAINVVQIWLTTARRTPELSKQQIIRLESLRSRLRCYGREVQA